MITVDARPTAAGRRLRVALLSYDFGEYSVQVANALAPDAEVLLALPAAAVAAHQATLCAMVHLHAFQKPRLRQPIHQLLRFRELTQAIHQFNPDVVHVQQGHLWLNLMLPALRRYPLVITVHDPAHHPGDRPSHKTPQWLTDFGFHQATRLIVHGQSLKDSLVRRCSVEAERVDVIPHIALGSPEDEPAPSEPGERVLFLGRIWPYKGLEYLIAAEPAITSAVPTARIVIAGQGEAFERYRDAMVHPERFEIINEYISDGLRDDLFRKATVVVLPYIEASQSGVIPLAYRFGKPVVATTVGALPEAVEAGRTGILVPARDSAALADAVIHLLHHDELRRVMGINGQRKLLAEWGPEAIAIQTLATYGRALHDRQHASPIPRGEAA